jgi:cell division initiation protein
MPMKLTALEIKQQQFEKAIRGYDQAEVQSYLNLLATEWEFMVGKIRELENKISGLNDKLKHYERVEEALHETLQTAKSSAEEKLTGARKEARNIIEKAELEAETIYQEAHRERWKIRQHTLQIVEKREEMVQSLKSFLENVNHSLDQFSGDKQSLFTIPDMPHDDQNPIGASHRKKEKTYKKESDSSIPDVPGNEKIDDILDQID